MTATWAWWLNVIGLGMNTVAAALMYFYLPTVTQYTAKGEGAVTWVTLARGSDAALGPRLFYSPAVSYCNFSPPFFRARLVGTKGLFQTPKCPCRACKQSLG